MADKQPIIDYYIGAHVLVDGQVGRLEQVMVRELIDDPVAFPLALRLFDEQLAKKIEQHQADHGALVK
jgi:hypothetical protein